MTERSTERPPFDPAQFARDAESRLAETPASRRTTPRAFPRPLLPADPADEAASQSTTARPPSGGDRIAAETIPVLVITREELEWFALSPNASRLIAHLDGVSPIAAVCSGADLPAAEGQSILLELSEQGIIGFR